MSVRKGDRGESKLEVLNDVRILADYTVRTCRSESVFPKSSRWIMSQRMVNECLDAMTCVRRANATYVSVRADYEYRHSQQMQAHAHVDALLSLIDLAFLTYDIDGTKVEHWTGLAVAADEKIKAWIKSDNERYKKFWVAAVSP